MPTPAQSSASAARSTASRWRSSSPPRACACSAPDGTAKRLGERLALLTRAAPDLPERRRSLRATIDWSYQLLDEPARHVFRVLAVFAGGATLEAVEAVADDGVDVPRSLETLLDASLATVHQRSRRTAALRPARDDPRVCSRRAGDPWRSRRSAAPLPRALPHARRGGRASLPWRCHRGLSKRARARARQLPRSNRGG